MNPLKIGFIANDSFVDKHYFDLASILSLNTSIELSVLYIQSESAFLPPQYKSKSFSSRLASKLLRLFDHNLYSQLLFSFLCNLERKRLNLPARSLWSRKHRIDHFFASTCTIVPSISTSGFVYRYSSSIVNEIKSQNLDVLIRCGSGILRGEILSCSQFGVLSLHHADNRINRGGPPGFWEVLNKQPTTGFIIQQLTNELDAGNVLFRGSFPTQPTFLANQINVKERSIYYFGALISQLA